MRLIGVLLVALLTPLAATSAAHASTATTSIRPEGYTYDRELLASTDATGAVLGSSVVAQLTGHQPTMDDRRVGVPGASTTPSSRSLATNNGGGLLPPPSVSDSKLQNLVNNLWKGTANSSPVGNGTTADAVRYERNTGQPVGGKFHTIKAQETVNGLRNWLNNNPNASYSDRLVAQSLLDDLLDALNCVP